MVRPRPGLMMPNVASAAPRMSPGIGYLVISCVRMSIRPTEFSPGRVNHMASSGPLAMSWARLSPVWSAWPSTFTLNALAHGSGISCMLPSFVSMRSRLLPVT